MTKAVFSAAAVPEHSPGRLCSLLSRHAAVKSLVSQDQIQLFDYLSQFHKADVKVKLFCHDCKETEGKEKVRAM